MGIEALHLACHKNWGTCALLCRPTREYLGHHHYGNRDMLRIVASYLFCACTKQQLTVALGKWSPIEKKLEGSGP